MHRLPLSLILIAVWSGANAAPLPDYIKDNVGEWLIAPDDGKPGCRVGLKGEAITGGYRIIPGQECAVRLPVVAGVSAWTFDGGVRLLGADRKILLEFSEDETTMMKTSFERKPIYFIVRAKAGVERAPYAPALVGTWVLRRPAGPSICTLTLSKGPMSEETELSAKTGTPCDPAVARLKLTSARVEDFKLMLYGQPETSLGFEPSGADAYAKTDGGKPLEMVRAP